MHATKSSKSHKDMPKYIVSIREVENETGSISLPLSAKKLRTISIQKKRRHCGNRMPLAH